MSPNSVYKGNLRYKHTYKEDTIKRQREKRAILMSAREL